MATIVDPQDALAFGTDLTKLAAAGSLPRAYGVREPLEHLLTLLGREPRRSIALLGAAGTGKTALVQELVYELAKPEHGNWRVLRASPTDFMAGTRYSGEWETRVRDLVDAAKRIRRLLVYVPNLADLSVAGTWSRSESSVATALAPYLEDGTVLVLGESTAEEFERGLGRIPGLQRLFDRVLVDEATVDQTRQVLAAIRDDRRLSLSDEVLEQLLDLSRQFLSHVSRPGNAVTLLRTVDHEGRRADGPITFREILEALSKSTGVPIDLLDDSARLDGSTVRAFFEKRIIGQPDAVDAVTDLVTLIKAGLTDPNKPFGVFLFVGPTGVGKTELARALAEFIFGDVSRLKRFDMSEFASVEGFLRLIGSPSQNGLLTDAVLQHPFSVVLLDEIEKSHVNVFDLCLQIFDAGRLTDGRGRTIDFRRTIVILTSNIGASVPTTPLGFGARGEPASIEADKDRTFRELSRFFRPEFLNRLDRIVQFRPLSLEVAEQVARREMDLVLQRAGIRRRSLTVEVSPALLALLVREGYSPHFGARPLKRTVERLLLLPLARAIASGRIRDRAIVHVNERGGRVEITTTTAERSDVPAAITRAGAGAPVGMVDDLRQRFHAAGPSVAALADRKSALLETTRQPGFYEDAGRRASTFDDIHKLEQLLSSWNRLGDTLDSLHTRLQKHSASKSGADSRLRETLSRLAAELDHLCLVVSSGDTRDLSDALVSISLVERSGAPQGGVETLARMYHGLARRRMMTAEILGELVQGGQDVAHLHMSGMGTYALLKHEGGLHQLDRRFKHRGPHRAREVMRNDREIVRVDVLPLGAEPDEAFRRSVKATLAPLKPARHRLIKCDTAVSLFHEPTARSVAFWTSGPRQTALDRGMLLLYGQLAAASAPDYQRTDAIVREYELGVGPRIRDTRTGRSTTNVARVLKGQLEGLR